MNLDNNYSLGIVYVPDGRILCHRNMSIRRDYGDQLWKVTTLAFKSAYRETIDDIYHSFFITFDARIGELEHSVEKVGSVSKGPFKLECYAIKIKEFVKFDVSLSTEIKTVKPQVLWKEIKGNPDIFNPIVAGAFRAFTKINGEKP